LAISTVNSQSNWFSIWYRSQNAILFKFCHLYHKLFHIKGYQEIKMVKSVNDKNIKIEFNWKASLGFEPLNLASPFLHAVPHILTYLHTAYDLQVIEVVIANKCLVYHFINALEMLKAQSMSFIFSFWGRTAKKLSCSTVLAPQQCRLESRQELFIFTCEEAIQLAFGTVVLFTCLKNARRGTWGLPPPVKLESHHLPCTLLVRRKTQLKWNKINIKKLSAS
jgi:hypothetical protein